MMETLLKLKEAALSLMKSGCVCKYHFMLGLILGFLLHAILL